MSAKKSFHLLIVGLAMIASSAFAQTGFDNGNSFEYTPAFGDITVHCPNGGDYGGPTVASYRCWGYAFAPAQTALFTGPRVDADEIELTAYRSDGSVRTKSSAYDRKTGTSRDTFNLWVETVFQRALLNIGRNDIKWVLKKRGNEVTSGSFFAVVDQNPTMVCPYAVETSWDPAACSNSSRVCRDYFYRYGSQCR